MSTATIAWSRPKPTNNGHPVAEGSDIPSMRPRTGPRGTDAKLADLLGDALENLADATCSFWACRGPSRPQSMCTCNKCWAMREIATVKASLEARNDHQR